MTTAQSSDYEVAKAKDGFFKVPAADVSKYEADLGETVRLGNYAHQGFLVPKDRLEEFRLTEEESRQVREAAEAAEGDEVAGFDLSLNNPFGLNFSQWMSTSKLSDRDTCC